VSVLVDVLGLMSRHVDSLIAATAAVQHGHITSTQLRAIGLTDEQIKYRTRVGRLVRVHPRVFRIGGTPSTPFGKLRAGTLATDGVASHRSAAWLLGLWDRTPKVVELTIPRPMRWRSDLVAHRLTDLDPGDLTTVDGIPCTDAARLLVDLGAVCKGSTVEKLFHQVMHEKRADFDEIVARFFRVARRGRSGCGVLRPILERHDPAIAPAESDLEVEMIQILRTYGAPPPTRQHPVEVAGNAFRLDLAYPERKIALEGDGFGIHIERGTFENDRARQNLLVLHGWLVLRFTWRMMIHTPGRVASDVLRAYDLRSRCGPGA